MKVSAGVSIVEVTNPSQPKLLAKVFWPDGAQLGQLTFLGDYAIGNVLPSSDGTAAGKGIVVWSLLHDSSPSPVLGFMCVTRAVVDQSYVYVLNDAGLWIVAAPKGETDTVSLTRGFCATASQQHASFGDQMYQDPR